MASGRWASMEYRKVPKWAVNQLPIRWASWPIHGKIKAPNITIKVKTRIRAWRWVHHTLINTRQWCASTGSKVLIVPIKMSVTMPMGSLSSIRELPTHLHQWMSRQTVRILRIQARVQLLIKISRQVFISSNSISRKLSTFNNSSSGRWASRCNRKTFR